MRKRLYISFRACILLEDICLLLLPLLSLNDVDEDQNDKAQLKCSWLSQLYTITILYLT